MQRGPFSKVSGVVRARDLFCLWLVVFLSFDAGIAGPQVTKVAPPDALHFEIVSIRESKRTKGSTIEVTPNGFRAIGFPLGATLLLAYFPPPFYKHDAQLHGAPKWLFEDIYDVEARVPSTEAAQWQALSQDVFMYKQAAVLQVMLREVLADRCLLRVHRVDSKSTGYALALDGRKKLVLAVDMSGTHPPAGDQVPDGGFRSHSVKDGEDVQTFYQTSMSGFVEWLNLTATYPIVDRTGLKGRYLFSIRHLPQDRAGDPELTVPWKLDELGIKLERTEVPTHNLYIDQIQKPSSN